MDVFERFGDRINKTCRDGFGWVTRENRRNQAELLVLVGDGVVENRVLFWPVVN